MKRALLLFSILTGGLLGAQTFEWDTPTPPAPASDTRAKEVVIPVFEQQPAEEEMLRVVNPTNGRSILLPVRELTLSAAAARELGLIPPRPADVAVAQPRPAEERTTPKTYNRYPKVAPPPPTVPAEDTTSGGSPSTANFTVQLAAYNNEAYARRKVEELRQQGVAGAFYRQSTNANGQVINRVYSGHYADLATAQAAAQDLKGRLSIEGIVAEM